MLKVHGHAMQQPGWPDLQVYHVSWFGQLELKCGRNSASTAQRIIIGQLRRRGFPAYILREHDGELQLEDGVGIQLGDSWRWDGTGRQLLEHLIAVG
jgi:hypothetical protein